MHPCIFVGVVLGVLLFLESDAGSGLYSSEVFLQWNHPWTSTTGFRLVLGRYAWDIKEALDVSDVVVEGDPVFDGGDRTIGSFESESEFL